jgi:hypothetical protein
MAIEVVSVAAGNEDANERDNGTAFSFDALSMNISANASAGSRWNSGAIFHTSIPQGAVINTAHLEAYFATATSDDVDGAGACEDVDTPDDYETTQDVTSRTITSASAAMLAADIGTGRQTIPQSLHAPIQEVVDRPGFSGSINLIVRGAAAPDAGTDEGCVTRCVDGFAEPWELTIDYDAGDAGPLDIERRCPRGVARGIARGVV